MAVTNLTELWQLAATLMGEKGTAKIIDATAPSLPLELTFAAFYDQVRVTLIKRGSFEFARETKLLREAPTVDYDKVTHAWPGTDRWNYLYAPPIGSIGFVKFAQDNPMIGLHHDYIRPVLPIAYTTVFAGIAAGSALSSDASNSMPNNLWRGWMRADFQDDDQTRYVVVDLDLDTRLHEYNLIDEDSLEDLQGSTERYSGGGGWGVDFANGAGYNFASASYPTLTMEVAYGLNVSSPHIQTNLPDAEAVYLVDITDPSRWPEEFQIAIASEMARRAALVHSKSSKMLQGLSQAAAFDFSEAVASLTADDGTIYSGQMSAAELARL